MSLRIKKKKTLRKNLRKKLEKKIRKSSSNDVELGLMAKEQMHLKPAGTKHRSQVIVLPIQKVS